MKKHLLHIFTTALLVSLALSCSDHSDTEHSHAPADDHKQEHIDHALQGGSTDLTLIQVMHDLAKQTERTQFGILTNNRYMIEAGAAAITDHPSPKGGLKPYLRKNADRIQKEIPALDEAIHKNALEMKKKAHTASMAELQLMQNQIVTACVGCHNLFRD